MRYDIFCTWCTFWNIYIRRHIAEKKSLFARYFFFSTFYNKKIFIGFSRFAGGCQKLTWGCQKILARIARTPLSKTLKPPLNLTYPCPVAI